MAKGANQIIRQRDFSGGEVVEHAKRRDDEPAVRSGARTLRNVRILASGAVEQRPGRSALFQHTGPVHEVRLDSVTTVFLCFGAGSLTIRSSAGAVLAQAWGYAWTASTAVDAAWALFGKDIVITFDGQIPKIARWDGSTGWVFLDWAATTTSAGRKLVPFVRFAPAGVTMALSALTGSVTVTFSAAVLNASHVGTRMRYYDKQLTITAVTSSLVGTATVNEVMRSITSKGFTADVTDQFVVGDIIEGATNGARFYVAEVGTPGTDDATLIRLNSIQSTAGEIFIGPTGSAEQSATTTVTTGPAITVWDEELFNAYRGYPRSVTVDQNRLIFSDFPGAPEAIAWSASGDPFNFASGSSDDADPTDAIVEFVPKKARVYHVMDGADEFVFTDLGIYYVPISESNPLRPGSVGFRRIPGAPASQVRPVSTAQGLVYANAARNRVLAIIGTGQTAQPYLIRPASDLQSHLFNDVTCLAVEEGGGDPPDELVYVVNGDGTVVVGRYQIGKDWAGWVLWEGEGDVRWISVANSAALFSTEYAAGCLIERVNADSYLDAAVDYDAIPAALGTGAQADVLISNGQGTMGGNMTAAGGLAAARDGTTSQAAAACASRASSSGYIYVTFAQPMKIAKVEVWPSNNNGFSDAATVGLGLYGKNGVAPVSGSDGTLIGSVAPFADSTSMQSMTSSDEITQYDHVVLDMSSTGAGNLWVAEIRIYSPGATHGSGEIWYLANATVDVMDGLRVVGSQSIDSNGELTSPSGIDDEQIGFGYDVTIEPFVPHVGPGQSVGQTHTKRQMPGVAIAVQNSTGFKVQSWKPNSQEWATDLTRGAYDENATTAQRAAAPVAREEVKIAKPQGSEIDPRIRIIKDYPGPLRVLEIGPEIGA